MHDDFSKTDPDWILGRLEYEESRNDGGRSKRLPNKAPMTSATPIKRPASLLHLGQIARGITHLGRSRRAVRSCRATMIVK